MACRRVPTLRNSHRCASTRKCLTLPTTLVTAQEYQPKKRVAPPAKMAASGSGKGGKELTASEIVERRELDRKISRVYTMEEGERAVAYEKAQRGGATPGPGEYEAPTLIGRDSENVAVKYQDETRGFKTDLDWVILRASKLPSAQEYGAYKDPRYRCPLPPAMPSSGGIRCHCKIVRVCGRAYSGSVGGAACLLEADSMSQTPSLTSTG